MTIAVTGATGQLGRIVIEKLKAKVDPASARPPWRGPGASPAPARALASAEGSASEPVSAAKAAVAGSKRLELMGGCVRSG